MKFLFCPLLSIVFVMFNFLVSQLIPRPIFCTPASPGHASVTGTSIGSLQSILLRDIQNLFCDLILKRESTCPEFVWGFQCSLLGSKIHHLGEEKSNSLHGSTQVVNIHYLGQIHNLDQNNVFSYKAIKNFHFLFLDYLNPIQARGVFMDPKDFCL